MGNNVHFFRQSGGVLQLVAQYDFNNNLIDSIGGNNGTGTNITYNSGNYGNEAVLNGSNSFINIADNDAFTFNNGANDLPFKIEMILKLNNINNNQMLMNKRNPSTNGEYQIQVGSSTFSFILLSQNVSKNISKQLNVSPSLDNYYNIILEYDGSQNVNGMKMTVNGVVDNITNSNPNYTNMSNTTAPITLGKRGWQNRDFLNGAFSQIKVYK